MSSNCIKTQQACVEAIAIDQPDCANTEITPRDVLIKGVIAKIPVVLAELAIQVNVDSTITLPEPALEIKQIKKRLKVTQCMLLQDTNKLFIRGFVRKNIEYATRSCSNTVGFCGDIRHCTVDIPFRCVTPVTFNVKRPAPLRFNTTEEFEYFRTQSLPLTDFAEKDQLAAGDFSEFNQITNEYFNELPFCELISSKITEFDEFINRTRPVGVELPFEELEFEVIDEKMVIDITLKLLQNRQVAIPASHSS
jgi:hypothetical protein